MVESILRSTTKDFGLSDKSDVICDIFGFTEEEKNSLYEKY